MNSDQGLPVAAEQAARGNICVLNAALQICHHITIGSKIEKLLVTTSFEFQSLATGDQFVVVPRQFSPGCFQLNQLGLKNFFALRPPRHTSLCVPAPWGSSSNCPR